MPHPRNRRSIGWWDRRARSNDLRRPDAPQNRRVERTEGVTTRPKLSIAGILSQTKFVNQAALHRKPMVYLQILALAVTTAAVGAVVARFIPESAIGGASNGVYIAGIVLILLIETVYQWGLRASMLATEVGLLAYANVEESQADVEGLKSQLESQRNSNVEKLRRALEPMERVSLLALALLTHLIAQESADKNDLFGWATMLAKDVSITLLLGLAGLLWQLKNQDHIGTLTSGPRVQRILRSIGNLLMIAVIPLQALGSIIVLSVLYFPWGMLAMLPLVTGVVWYRNLHRTSREP